MDRDTKSPKPASAKAQAQARGQSSPGSPPTGWLPKHLTLIMVIGLAVLVLIVILVAASRDNDGTPAPRVRPDSSGPIQVGELELDVHQWNCGLTTIERVADPSADPIQAAPGNHFCTLAIQVTNHNTEKFRAFDPGGQRVVFGGQEYVYHVVATRDGLGATSGVRILSPGIGVNPDTIPPLITLVFELPQDQTDAELDWRENVTLLLTDGSGDQEALVEIPLKDYDKQS